MTQSTPAETGAAVEDLAADVATVLGSPALAADPQIPALRQRIQESLGILREKARQQRERAARKAREAAAQVDTYVHEEPWHAAAGTLAAGLAIGLAIGLLLGRRLDD